jgi:23S rRNA pseudouridine955/2504/2580 synthase
MPKFADLILFENNDVIVVNKPPFISSLDEREGGEINMLRLAKQLNRCANMPPFG